MVSNFLSPYSSTLAMQVQNDSGGCGKRRVSGFINAEDNKDTVHWQKTEQMALGSFPGLAHHPKMGASSYILPRVFEPPSYSKLGPAGPIAVNDPDAKLRGTSSKGTSKTADHSSGHMSPSAAGVAGKPRSRGQGSSPARQPRARARRTCPGRHLRIYPYVRNYTSPLTLSEYAQSLPRSSTGSRGLITRR
jgi:hypothetical protein